MQRLSRRGDAEALLAYWSPSADSLFVTEPAVLAQGTMVIHGIENLRRWLDASRTRIRSVNYPDTGGPKMVLMSE
jgi:hypothetical protein